MNVSTKRYAKEQSEHSLQVHVLLLLSVKRKTPDIFAIAIPNSGKRSLYMGRRMKHEGLMPGVADLQILLPKGRSAWLELKSSDGRQSVEQRGFAARCERLGHPYGLARTIEEAETFLGRIGALK